MVDKWLHKWTTVKMRGRCLPVGWMDGRASLVAQLVENMPMMRETLDSIPGLGRSPGEGNGNPLQYSCLENSMDRGAWWATVHGVAKSRIRVTDQQFHYSVKSESES